MGREFDLKLNFSTPGVDSLDAANKKVADLSKQLNTVIANLGKLGKASQATSSNLSQMVNAATAASNKASAAAANMTQAANQANAAYKQLLNTIQQTAQAQAKVKPAPAGGGNNAGGGGGNNAGGGGGNNAGGGGGNNAGGGGSGGFSTVTRMLGLGVGAYAIRAIANDIRQIIVSATEGARSLQNLADEFGISAQKAFQLQAAANLTGVELGTMAAAARKLSIAIEEPGTSGKLTAEALTRLGVSINQDLGSALTESIQKLGQMQDHTEAVRMAVTLFGREGTKMLELSKSMDDVGQSLDQNVQEKLLEANRELKDFGNQWTIWRGQGIAAIKDVYEWLHKFDVGQNPDNPNEFGNLREFANAKYLQSLKPKAPGLPGIAGANPFGEAAGVSEFISRNDKINLEDEISASKKEYEDALERLKSAQKTGSQSGQSSLLKTAESALNKYNKLEDKLKALGKADHADEKLDEWAKGLEELKNSLQYPKEFFGDLGKLNMQRERDIDRVNNTKYASQATKDHALNDIQQLYSMQAILESRRVSEQQENERIRQEADLQKETLRMQAHENRERFDHFFSPDQLEYQKALIEAPYIQQRDDNHLAFQATQGIAKLSQISALPGQGGNVAAQDLDMRMRQIQMSHDEAVADTANLSLAEQLIDKEKIRQETAKDSMEAILQYEQSIAEIRKSQMQESRNFLTGLFDASISHQPSATTNYLRGIGRGYLNTIVGNFGESTFGTLESRFGLQQNYKQSGILGAPTGPNGQFQPNFLGKLLSGTPFGPDPTKTGGDSIKNATDQLKDATKDGVSASKDLNTSIKNLTDMISKVTGVPAPGGGGTSDAGSSMGSSPSAGGSRASAANGTASIGGAISGFTNAISGFGGAFKAASTGNWSGILPSLRGAFGGGMGPGGTAPFMTTNQRGSSPVDPRLQSASVPDDTNASPIVGNPTVPIGSSASGMPAPPDIKLDGSTLYDPLKDVAATLSHLPTKDDVISGDLTKTNSTVGKLAGLMGGQGGWQGLQELSSGQRTDANGNVSDMTGWQTAGDVAAVGSQVAAGAYGAYKGFKQGGARGISEGIGSVLGTAASFDPDPLSRSLLSGGAMIAGLVGAVLPDPRQQRQKGEAKTEANDAFMAPAARDYDYAAGSGSNTGFSLGANSTVRAGGPSANYNITFSPQALDSGSFVTWMQNNPQAAAQAMLFGLQNGGSNALEAELAWRMQNNGNWGLPTSSTGG